MVIQDNNFFLLLLEIEILTNKAKLFRTQWLHTMELPMGSEALKSGICNTLYCKNSWDTIRQENNWPEVVTLDIEGIMMSWNDKAIDDSETSFCKPLRPNSGPLGTGMAARKLKKNNVKDLDCALLSFCSLCSVRKKKWMVWIELFSPFSPSVQLKKDGLIEPCSNDQETSLNNVHNLAQNYIAVAHKSWESFPLLVRNACKTYFELQSCRVGGGVVGSRRFWMETPKNTRSQSQSPNFWSDSNS